MFTYMGPGKTKEKEKNNHYVDNRILAWNIPRFPKEFLGQYKAKTPKIKGSKDELIQYLIDYESSKQTKTKSCSTAKSGRLRPRVYDLNGERKTRRST